MLKLFLLVLTRLAISSGGGMAVVPNNPAGALNWTTVAVTSSATITTSCVQIVGANSLRKWIKLYNNSSNSVYLSLMPNCNSSTTLFAIVPTFANYDMSVNWQGAIYGIRNAGTGNVVATEMW